MSRKRLDLYEKEMQKALHEILRNMIHLKKYRAKQTLDNYLGREEEENEEEEEEAKEENEEEDENEDEEQNEEEEEENANQNSDIKNVSNPKNICSMSSQFGDDGNFEEMINNIKCSSNNTLEEQHDIIVGNSTHHSKSQPIMSSSKYGENQSKFVHFQHSFYSTTTNAVSNSKSKEIKYIATEEKQCNPIVQENKVKTQNKVRSGAEAKVLFYKRRLLPSIPKT